MKANKMSSKFCSLFLFYLIFSCLVICDVQSALNGTAAVEMATACGLAKNISTYESTTIDGIPYNTTHSSNEFPWHAFLTVTDTFGSSANCGGFLIDSKWVLTAARCFHTGLKRVTKVTIYLGSRDVRSVNDTNRVVLVSDKICTHPEHINGKLGKDIALIRLPTEIKFNDFIRPVCLPNSSYPDHVGDPVTLTGWRSAISDSKYYNKVHSTVVSNSQCAISYNIANISDQHICTLSTYVYYFPYLCPIGVGGPVSYQNPDGSWTAIGVMSDCERKGNPVAHTRIKYYLDWIQSMKQNDSATCMAPTYIWLPPETTACGLANEQTSINSPNEFPWQVNLLVNRAGDFSPCIGILIDSRWVLTTARCFDNGSNRVDNVTILLGSLSVMRKILISDQICIHPNYTNGVIRGKDIALIRLPTEIKISNNIRPVCLPNSTYPDHVGDAVTLSGWQDPSSSLPGLSTSATKFNLTVVSNSQCETWFKTSINDQYICTLGIADYCYMIGSGGPVNYQNVDGSWTAIGLLSECASRYDPPAISTRIKYHLDWIQSVKDGNTVVFGAFCIAPIDITTLSPPATNSTTALTTLSTGASSKLSTTTKPFTGCDDSSANSILVSSSAMTIIIAAVVFLLSNRIYSVV